MWKFESSVFFDRRARMQERTLQKPADERDLGEAAAPQTQ
jgi:hypothetical protein